MKAFLFVFLFSALAMAAPDYNQLYPQYTEICTLSQRSKNDAPSEGAWGHVLMYVRGACIDPRVSYPRLMSCAPSAENGVMVSLNSFTKNVHWIATPGEQLSYRGLLQPGETLTAELYERTIQTFMDVGIYKGVQLHDKEIAPPDRGKSHLYRAAKSSIDIDAALSYGRDSFCARLPLNDVVKTDLITALNRMNDAYALHPERTFQWDYFFDNCAHLVHNSLAALGVWKPMKTNQSLPVQLNNIGVPANIFIELVKLTKSTELENPLAVFKNAGWRTSLIEKNWLPMQHGVVVRTSPRHTPNEMYAGNLKVFVMDVPFSQKNRKLFNLYTQNPNFKNAHYDLQDFAIRYQRALSSLKDPSEYVKSLSSDAERKAFLEFYPVYKAYLIQQLNNVKEKLNEFENAAS